MTQEQYVTQQPDMSVVDTLVTSSTPTEMINHVTNASRAVLRSLQDTSLQDTSLQDTSLQDTSLHDTSLPDQYVQQPDYQV